MFLTEEYVRNPRIEITGRDERIAERSPAGRRSDVLANLLEHSLERRWLWVSHAPLASGGYEGRQVGLSHEVTVGTGGVEL